MRRREILALGAAALAAPAAARSRAGRVLVLGGTNFIGPHLVRAALARGHEVTLFNRGATNADLFPDLEKLRGDRMKGREGLAALGADRRWDLVIDTWSLGPEPVEVAAELLKDRAGAYAFVSSISAYGDFDKISLTEDDPAAATPSTRDRADYGYVVNKRLCEIAVLHRFGGRGLVCRPSMLLGFDEGRDPANQLCYWPLRVRQGGELVAPGDGSSLAQHTDAADFAAFMVARGERGEGGLFNTVSDPYPLRTMIETAMRHARTDARPVWMDEAFLAAHDARPFRDIPMWISKAEPSGFYQISNAKAVAAGFRRSPLDQPVAAILKTFADRPAGWAPDWRQARGLPADLEARLLTAWKARA